MLDDVFNYTEAHNTLQKSQEPDMRYHDILFDIEQALQALARALEQLKSLRQESVSPPPKAVHEVSAAQSILTKETIETTYVEFKSSQQGSVANEQKIIEGFFNGEAMVDASGRIYSVPANYASKSKLVEGDGMKLIVTPSGSFVYKQIAPAERQRLIGTLEQSDSRDYYVRIGERRFRVLTASITYYKGMSGDEAIILVPKFQASSWAAIENIIKNI